MHLPSVDHLWKMHRPLLWSSQLRGSNYQKSMCNNGQRVDSEPEIRISIPALQH